mgnify:CR=1 FL=1
MSEGERSCIHFGNCKRPPGAPWFRCNVDCQDYASNGREPDSMPSGPTASAARRSPDPMRCHRCRKRPAEKAGYCLKCYSALCANDPIRNAAHKTGRNDHCPCGSGRKYKRCCLSAEKARNE